MTARKQEKGSIMEHTVQKNAAHRNTTIGMQPAARSLPHAQRIKQRTAWKPN
jgi:hypothetical protein